MKFSLVRAAGLAALGLVCWLVLSGHEYWLEPDRFLFNVGQTAQVGIRVGEHFAGEVRPWNPAKFTAVVHHDQLGARALSIDSSKGLKTQWPLTFTAAGGQLLTVATTNSSIELAADKFEAYLREDGMEYVVAERARLGESALPGREQYLRCAKLLMQVGPPLAADTTYKMHTGLALEILPERNPYLAKSGERLPVRVLYQGKPLANALVAVRSRHAAPHDLQTVRTGPDGRALVPLPPAGPCLISLVHMVRVADSPSVQWQSYWGSYCFEVQR
jgi:hypothetical protein